MYACRVCLCLSKFSEKIEIELPLSFCLKKKRFLTISLNIAVVSITNTRGKDRCFNRNKANCRRSETRIKGIGWGSNRDQSGEEGQ